MATVETYQLRGRNYDEVVRQLISTYNVANGWSLVRVVNRLTSLDVILERNSEQGVSKDTGKETQKDTSTGTTQPLETKEIASNDAVEDVSKDTTTEKPVAVKTTRKSANKG